MKKCIKLLFGLCILLLGSGCLMSNSVAAASKNELIDIVKSQTTDKVKEVYYTDYDYDGTKEAFIITEYSQDLQTLWFVSEKQVKKIAHENICTGERRGVCKVSSTQKLFVAEGSCGGSGSWSYCLYVKLGKVCFVKRTGEGLVQISGRKFSISPSAFDANCCNGDWTGHTWKIYYLRWTGTKFVHYKAKQISISELKKYDDADLVLNKIKKAGYSVTTIFKRENGIININVCKKNKYSTDYNNVNLRVNGNKLKLLVIYREGKDIVQKSGYGGIYLAKTEIWKQRRIK